MDVEGLTTCTAPKLVAHGVDTTATTGSVTRPTLAAAITGGLRVITELPIWSVTYVQLTCP